MQVNRVKGVVERYVGEVAGADRWETVYDPKGLESDKGLGQ